MIGAHWAGGKEIRDLSRDKDIKPAGVDFILNAMQNDPRVENVVATLAAIWRMDLRGTKLDVLSRLSQWSRVDREMERWMETGQLLKFCQHWRMDLL